MLSKQSLIDSVGAFFFQTTLEWMLVQPTFSWLVVSFSVINGRPQELKTATSWWSHETNPVKLIQIEYNTTSLYIEGTVFFFPGRLCLWLLQLCSGAPKRFEAFCIHSFPGKASLRGRWIHRSSICSQYLGDAGPWHHHQAGLDACCGLTRCDLVMAVLEPPIA